MKNIRLHKVVTLVAALALASTAIAGDAFARGGGGGGGFSGAVAAAWEAAAVTAASAAVD